MALAVARGPDAVAFEGKRALRLVLLHHREALGQIEGEVSSNGYLGHATSPLKRDCTNGTP